MPEGELGYHHALVRAARLLHQKKHRLERRCFLVEGSQLVRDALAAGAKIESVFALREGLSDDLLARLSEAGAAIHTVDRRTLDSLAQTRTPQGTVGVAAFLHHETAELARLAADPGAATALVLPNLSDPGNAGTLVRAAEAFGALAVCFGPHAVEPYNDKVVRASMGSIFRVPIIWYESWEIFAALAGSARLALVGTAAQGEDVRGLTLPARAALVVGQERSGLAGIPAQDFDLVVAIPQVAGAESLNASVAGAIVLYEFARAQGRFGPSGARTSKAEMSSP